MKTLIMGASTDPHRFSFRAAHMLVDYGHEIALFGRSSGEIAGIAIRGELPEASAGVELVTWYLKAEHQDAYKAQIFALKPKRMIFNPGAENPSLMKEAEALGIDCVEDCTLVMLQQGRF